MCVEIQKGSEMDNYNIFLESGKNTSVEGAINAFIKERDAYLALSENDTVRSAAYYAAFRRLSEEFIEKVKKREFPQMTEGFWGYEVEYGGTEISLMLVKYMLDESEAERHIYYFPVIESYKLLTVEAKLLSVSEYAEHYSVDAKTVTQWIRRGKIRTAKKYGNAWMIPELSDTPTRGYTTAYYQLDVDVRPLSDEYPFLVGVERLMIEQDDEDKNKYIVYCHKPYDGNTDSLYPAHVEEFDTKEKEKFELGLIAHPRVKYVPNFRETIIPDFMRIHNVEWNVTGGE